MTERKETFHVYARAGKGTHWFVRMAESAEAARKAAEDDGHEVVKVRRPPHRPSSFPRK